VKGVVYYESIKRELETRPVYECRCDERLKTKAEESTRLAHTGWAKNEVGKKKNPSSVPLQRPRAVEARKLRGI
jgi:hypothetical protein